MADTRQQKLGTPSQTAINKQNKPFTHLEGILEGLIANPRLKPDISSIQDGIIIKFAPAAQSHFNKPWFFPDVSTDMLTTQTSKKTSLWPPHRERTKKPNQGLPTTQNLTTTPPWPPHTE
jgi:hypothetical protein